MCMILWGIYPSRPDCAWGLPGCWWLKRSLLALQLTALSHHNSRPMYENKLNPATASMCPWWGMPTALFKGKHITCSSFIWRGGKGMEQTVRIGDLPNCPCVNNWSFWVRGWRYKSRSLLHSHWVTMTSVSLLLCQWHPIWCFILILIFWSQVIMHIYHFGDWRFSGRCFLILLVSSLHLWKGKLQNVVACMLWRLR